MRRCRRRCNDRPKLVVPVVPVVPPSGKLNEGNSLRLVDVRNYSLTCSGSSGSSCSANQSRLMSLAEAMTNVVAGYCIAVVTQVLAFPLLGFRVPLGDSLIIGAIFTVVSIIRSYTLRRCFETLRLRGAKRVGGAR